MDTQELEKLKSALPSNHLDELSKRTGFSTAYIWQVLNEKRNQKPVIIDAAIQLAEEEKQAEEQRKNRIENL